MKSALFGEIFAGKYFFHIASLGPLLLITYRVLPTLVILVLIVVQSFFLLLVRAVNKKWVNPNFWFSSELLLLSITIALIDFLMTVFTPLLRSELGILLPYTMFQVIPLFRGGSTRTTISENRPVIFIDLMHSLGTYILMLIILSISREMLTYGSIELSIIEAPRNFPIEMSQRGNSRYFWLLASSTAGLLFTFTACNAMRSEK